MACYHPLTMYRLDDGDTTFNGSDRHVIDRNGFQVPCGQCFGCRTDRAVMWGIRAEHEAKLHGVRNEFVQLTVRPECMDEVFPNWSLDYVQFQLMLKRARLHFPGLRFLAGFEYGAAGRNPCNPNLGRPHIHAALFNCYFEDRKYWKKGHSGLPLFKSKLLDELWPFGDALTGSVTRASGTYIGQYCMKKITGKARSAFYRGLNPETGEIVDMRPEFARMSLRPGIGAGWYERYGEAWIRQGFCVSDGQKKRVPRYYERIFERVDLQHAVDLEFLKAERMEEAAKHADDNTPERLAVREQVARAKKAFQENR